jgi:hypothetical protein
MAVVRGSEVVPEPKAVQDLMVVLERLVMQAAPDIGVVKVPVIKVVLDQLVVSALKVVEDIEVVKDTMAVLVIKVVKVKLVLEDQTAKVIKVARVL